MSKVVSVEDAIALVQDNDVVAVSGYGTNGVPEKILMALGSRFGETYEPKSLTLMFAGGIGDGAERGLNHLGKEGLLARTIGGHYGLIPKIEKLAVENKIQAYNYPEGVITHLYRNIAAGKYFVTSHIGLETFVDPRQSGGKLNASTKEDLISLQIYDGDETLYYKGYPINIAIIRGTTADLEGNISLEKEPLSLENLSLAMAARNSGGIVICQVERIAQTNTIDARHVRIPGFMVDCVVLAEPEFHMQTFDNHYNPALSGELRVPLEQLPKMELTEKKVVARRAALELTPQAVVNLGVGIPSAVGNIASEERVSDRIMLTVDPGVYGGVPLTGYGFGASLNYVASIDHATQFDFIDGGGIDIACLGFAECDASGNINASKFANRIAGCGGFINISQNSKKIVFVGTFTSGGLRTSIKNGKLKIEAEGKHRKFVNKIEQITFSGSRAGRERRNILYVTERCVFRLRENGLELTEVAPGIDMQKQILDLLPFTPIINDVHQMKPELFQEGRLGLIDLMSEFGLDERISYNPGSNMLFLDFSGMRLKSNDDVDKIKSAVENVLRPIGKRVRAIVNYDSFWTDPEITDYYMDAVRYIENKFYESASRYSTNGFTRIQLAKGLEARQVHSHVVQNYEEARRDLRSK